MRDPLAESDAEHEDEAPRMSPKRDASTKIALLGKRRPSSGSARPMPETPAQWLREIVAAYADAHEAIPFGPLVGATVGPENLFHLAPTAFAKFRGAASRREVQAATDAALASYVAMQGHDPELISRPHIAFAFCYLAAHYGLRLLAEHEVTETMDFILSEEKTLDRLIKEAIETQ